MREVITNKDLEQVFCPLRQGQCVASCAMLKFDTDSVFAGHHSYVNNDGWEGRSPVYQRHTDYFCGLAQSDDNRFANRIANRIRVYGDRYCDGEVFHGYTDEQLEERKAAGTRKE